jgi:hypothetical protein
LARRPRGSTASERRGLAAGPDEIGSAGPSPLAPTKRPHQVQGRLRARGGAPPAPAPPRRSPPAARIRANSVVASAGDPQGPHPATSPAGSPGPRRAAAPGVSRRRGPPAPRRRDRIVPPERRCVGIASVRQERPFDPVLDPRQAQPVAHRAVGLAPEVGIPPQDDACRLMPAADEPRRHGTRRPLTARRRASGRGVALVSGCGCRSPGRTNRRAPRRRPGRASC